LKVLCNPYLLRPEKVELLKSIAQLFNLTTLRMNVTVEHLMSEIVVVFETLFEQHLNSTHI